MSCKATITALILWAAAAAVVLLFVFALAAICIIPSRLEGIENAIKKASKEK